MEDQQKMRPERLIVGILFLSVFITAGALIAGNIDSNYGLDQGQNLSRMFNATNEQNKSSVYYIIDDIESNITRPTKEKIIGGEVVVTEGLAEDNIIASAIRGIGLIGKSFKVTTLIINEIGMTIGMPSFMIIAILLAFIITVIFTIIYLIFKLNP